MLLLFSTPAGTAPSYRSSTRTSSISTPITSITGTEPTGAASGDGLLMVLMIENTGPTSPGTVNTPSGWTSLGSVSTSQFNAYAYVMRRGGSAPTYQVTWTVALDGAFKYAEINVVAIQDIAASGAVLDTYAWGSPGTSATVDPPSITTATGFTLSVAVAFSWAGWFSAPSAPTGYTLRAGGGSFDTAIADKTLVSAGTENPSAFGNADGSDAEVGLTLAFISVITGQLFDVSDSDALTLSDSASTGMAINVLAVSQTRSNFLD